MLKTPPHLEARGPRGFVSIFHGTSSSVARRRLRASDLSFWQSMPSFDIGRPGLHLQSGASVVLGGVGEPPGSRCTDFNPRAPCGARPGRQGPHRQGLHISIHAPRVGRDRAARRLAKAVILNFNPRAPCGARPLPVHRADRLVQFQSTRPVWGATFQIGSILVPRAFQSTRPVWGATCAEAAALRVVGDFNPRAPCGARLLSPSITIFLPDFNPRAPCGARPIYARQNFENC